MNATTAGLWTEVSGRLRRFIGSRVADPSDVDDILQDVFRKIHEGLGGVKNPDRLESWLFQVTRRAIADHFRRRSPSTLREDVPEAMPVPNVTAEVSSWLRPMMELLPEEDRKALRLVDLEGMGQKELADRLGLSVTGAKSRVQRARRRLKETLLACCHVEMDRRGNALGYSPRSGRCSCNSCG